MPFDFINQMRWENDVWWVGKGLKGDDQDHCQGIYLERFKITTNKLSFPRGRDSNRIPREGLSISKR